MVEPNKKAQTVLLKTDYLQKEGLRCVSIPFREILQQHRSVVASFFDIKRKQAIQLIEESLYPKMPLFAKNESSFISNAFYPGRFKRIYVDSTNGIPFLSSSAILDCIPTLNCKFISSKKNVDYRKLFVEKNWILVSRSGTVGNVSFAGEQFRDCCISEHVIRLIPKNADESGYVYAFLKTTFGQILMSSMSFGSVISELEPSDFSRIPVPNPSENVKKTISEKIVKSFNVRDEARTLLQQAEKRLFKALDLPLLESLKPCYLPNTESLRAFPVRISDWQHRFDGSFHSPLRDEIVKHLRSKAELTTIGDKTVSEKITLPGRFKRIYVNSEYGKPFLSSSDILQYDPVHVKHLSTTHHEKRISEQLTTHENTVLVTCSGTIGNVVLTPKHFEGWTASQHVLRIIPSKEINPGYVYLFLASNYGKELVKRFTYGSVVNEIDDKQLAQVEFPLISDQAENEIGNLVLEANTKWTQAYVLEKEAITELENLIRIPKQSVNVSKKPLF